MFRREDRRRPRFGAVTDPRLLGRRIEIACTSQLYLMSVSRRTGSRDESFIPQQSDYSAAWAARAHSAGLMRSSVRKTSFARLLAAIRHRVVRTALFRRLAPSTPVRGLNQEGLTPLTITDFVRSQPPAG
jgi:hypothetical protein